MSNFIEIKDNDRTLLLNLNRIISIESRNSNCSDFIIYLDEIDHGYFINKNQYKEIKAKLIDNNSKG